MVSADAGAMAELRANAGPHMRAWFARRDALTARTGRPQALLFTIMIYTDDSEGNAVGCERMVTFVVVWTDTCDDLGILCADSHKRCLGTFVLWLGVILCHTFRGAFVPVEKVLHAAADVVTILSHEPAAFSQARAAFGLLGHISDALGLSPSLSYGLFNQYKEGGLEPNEPLILNDRTRAACERWLLRLRSKVCNAFSPDARGELPYTYSPAIAGEDPTHKHEGRGIDRTDNPGGTEGPTRFIGRGGTRRGVREKRGHQQGKVQFGCQSKHRTLGSFQKPSRFRQRRSRFRPTCAA
jgi:hypothetical protein